MYLPGRENQPARSLQLPFPAGPHKWRRSLENWYNPHVKLEQITNRQILASYFRRDIFLHFYSLGDLDDFFWSRSTCYGVPTPRGLSRVVLLYRGPDLPVLLALGQDQYLQAEEISQLAEVLPDELYAHLSPGLEGEFTRYYSLQEYGPHYKMALEEPARLRDIPDSGTSRLGEGDLSEIEGLYRESYPDHAFEPRLLQTGKYIGCREQGKLVSVAGVHVFSAAYRVAALGNIATHPAYRNQWLARIAAARLCRELAEEVDFIGLNVKGSNGPALQLYRALGFKIRANYAEFALKRRF